MCDESIAEKNLDKIFNFVFNGHLEKQLDPDTFKKRIDNCFLYNYANPKK
jgi:hypothetical protein